LIYRIRVSERMSVEYMERMILPGIIGRFDRRFWNRRETRLDGVYVTNNR